MVAGVFLFVVIGLPLYKSEPIMEYINEFH